jgi:hypothetical protein
MKYTGPWIPAFAQIDLKYAYIKIKDGSTPANEITVKIGEGNLTYSEKRNIEYTLDRGILDEVREGDQVPVDVKLDFVWEYITGGTGSGSTPTVEDALKMTGGASDWVSTDTDECRPAACDIEVTYLPQPARCGDQEVITLADFRYEELSHDLRNGTVSVSGRCNITAATVVRSARTSS